MYSSLSSSDSQQRRAADVEEQSLQRRPHRGCARFMNASSSITVPSSMPKNPAAENHMRRADEIGDSFP